LRRTILCASAYSCARALPFESGVALALDWSARFAEKEAAADVWTDALLPALDRVANAIRRHAPSRSIEAFGIPTLPAAAALGCAFLSTSGLRAAWRQMMPGQPEQLWALSAVRENSGFTSRITAKSAGARDVAVLVSVADDIEPVFASHLKNLPPLRAVVHITRQGNFPHLIASPGQAADVAHVVQDGMRTVRRDYGNIGTVHLFMAVPAGLAVLIGQLLNTFGAIQTYEHVNIDGSGHYRPAALLRPSA
jgi:SMODS-associated and fused to various effectors sensor domain